MILLSPSFDLFCFILYLWSYAVIFFHITLRLDLISFLDTSLLPYLLAPIPHPFLLSHPPLLLFSLPPTIRPTPSIRLFILTTSSSLFPTSYYTTQALHPSSPLPSLPPYLPNSFSPSLLSLPSLISFSPPPLHSHHFSSTLQAFHPYLLAHHSQHWDT